MDGLGATHAVHGQADPTAIRAHFRSRACAGLLVFFVLCATLIALRRGPWLDEIWTLWQSRHDLPLAEIISRRWMADFHPPLFSFSHWLLALGFGDALLPHRMLNLLALGWAALFVAVTLRRFPASAALILVYSVLVLSLPASLEYFADSRSYFAQMCAFFIVAGAAIVILDSDDDLDWARDTPFVAILVPTIVAALNLHYISTLLVGLLLGALIFACARQGRRRWAWTVLIAALVAGVPLLLFLVAQAQFLGRESATFWLVGTLREAVLIMLRCAAAATRANPLILAVAGAAFLVAAAAALPRGRLKLPGEPIFDADFAGRLSLAPRRRRTVLLLCAVLAAFAAIMLLAHLRQPIVTGRYLLTFQAGVMAVVACLAAEAVAHRRVLFALAVLCAAGAIAWETPKFIGERRWEATGGIVSQLIASCRSSPVYAAPLTRATPIAHAPEVLDWGYRWQADRHGFNVSRFDLRAGVLPPAADACPTLVWVEHVPGDLPKTADGALQRLGLDASGIDLAQATVTLGETGFVLKLPRKP